MSIMKDRDAANIMPGVGDMSVVNEVSSAEVQVFVFSPAEQQEEKQYRILVVEDDLSLARIEANFLTAHNYTVMIVGNGELAISTLNDFVPDLVVLDLELPGLLTGWDVLQILRQNTRVPVILATSLQPDVRKYCRTHGETRQTLDHLPKPYQMQALLKHIKRMLTIAPQ
jgi:DNA-binding response OmpR family regulator